MKFFKKLNLTVVVFCVCCIAFVAFLAYNPSHAYFQVHKDAIGVNTAKVDLLFDKYADSVFTLENSEDSLEEEKRTYKGPELNQNAEWGTEANPYIIRKKNHINNLAMLHKAGYFKDKTGQSYFVVCNLDGTPVAINCSEDAAMEIAPIGTPSNPFTGNINGAYVAGTAKYGSYSVSQSTIANLTVNATENTPDIGFFGRLGYNGTVETVTNTSTDDLGNTITSETLQLTGYAANLNNLLFADVTITTTQSPGSALETWWDNFIKKDEDGNNVTDEDDNVVRNDYYHEKCEETHHLGIIAGHAEWASLSNISIYYSEDVPAFDVGADTTNYYSIVGLLGTLSYVNPPAGAAAGTVIAIGSVSDEQLNEDLLSGGGGEGSGMLTGYMLAENIFNRKDAANQKTTLDYYAEAYDIRTLTESRKSLFTVRTMSERLNAQSSWTYKNYYYFADTVFTFAMTTSVESNQQGNVTGELSSNTADFLIKIWDTNEDNRPITKSIELTNSNDDWSYGPDPDTIKYIYKLTAVSTVEKSDNSKYVLAYNAGTAENPKLYVLDMFNESSGYAVPIETYISGNTYKVSTQNGQISSMYTLDVRSTFPSYAFLYNARYEQHTDTNNTTQQIAITDADKTNSFGLRADPINAGSLTYYGDVEFLRSTFKTTNYNNKNDKMVDLNAWSDADSALAWFGWEFSSDTSSNITNDFIISGKFYHYCGNGWGSNRYTAYSTKLVFNYTTQQFEPIQGTTGKDTNSTRAENNRQDPIVDVTTQEDNLLVFKIEKATDTPVASETFINSDASTVHTFNPSTDVLFCQPVIRGNTKLTTAQIASTRNYTVTPLLAKQWNNGKGQYLSELNHTVKLAEPNRENFQMNFSGTAIENWFGTTFNSNTGGVVLAPLGTTGINFTLPVGTIAFYINKASTDDPSTINIIVAVGPGDGDSTLGLFGPQDISQTKSSFKLDDPYQAFALPVSRVATSATDTAPLTHISGYYKLETDQTTGEEKYVLHQGTDNQGYYTYLNGDIVFVGCTFEVTEPGVYLLAPTVGKMSVAYFSVDGAAGSGGDGTGGSPLGDIDFVYDNGNNTILTVDKKFTGSHVVSSEDLDNLYYPSYFYIRMIPAIADTSKNKPAVTFPSQELYIRRYIVDDPPTIQGIKSDRRRVIKLTATDPDTKLLGLSAIYQDVDYDTIDTSS